MNLLLALFLVTISLFSLERKETLKSVEVKSFQNITYTEFVATEKFFRDLLKDNTQRDKNFVITKDKDILVVKEKNPRGQGLFLLHTKGKNSLQMPHCFFDTYTCTIGWKLFFENNFLFAQFSSIHRYTNAFSDLAHNDYNHFTALASAFAKEKEGLLIQIHGFAKKKRKSEVGRAADIIISNGTKRVDSSVQEIHQCFKELSFASKLYPLEVKELGGTTNASNKIIKSIKSGGFIHIELSREFRKKLLKSKKIRKEFGKCLS